MTTRIDPDYSFIPESSSPGYRLYLVCIHIYIFEYFSWSRGCSFCRANYLRTYNLYIAQNIIWVTKSEKINWAEFISLAGGYGWSKDFRILDVISTWRANPIPDILSHSKTISELLRLLSCWLDEFVAYHHGRRGIKIFPSSISL
jgi:hypothetical protein